jgi:hypothetical protein
MKSVQHVYTMLSNNNILPLHQCIHYPEANRTRKTPKYEKPTKYQNMGLCLCQLMKAGGLGECFGASVAVLI